jgi:hypothetical protein
MGGMRGNLKTIVKAQGSTTKSGGMARRGLCMTLVMLQKLSEAEKVPPTDVYATNPNI